MIGKSKSTISRELKRNKLFNGSYKALRAQEFYEFERKKCCKKSKLQNQAVISFVEEQLTQDKSPEQIAGIMRIGKMDIQISHETVYQYVWRDKGKGGLLHKHLRNQGRRYRKRGSSKDNRGIITGRIGIERRPPIVDQKARVGDMEIDLVIGKNHKHPILTVVERKSGMAWLRKVADKSADAVEKELLSILLPVQDYIHTITSDNGKEFANHKSIAKKLTAGYFFARPYHSWERGCNENYNRLLRQYLPKKTDFTEITDQQLMDIQNKLNNRERKRLGYISPIDYLTNHSLTKVAFAT